MKNKTLWLMVGLPGSGKTYKAKHFLMQGPGWRYISRDEIREKYFLENEECASYNSEAFELFLYHIKEALNGEGIFNVIADSTHINWASRKKLLTNLKHEVDFNKINIVPTIVLATEETCINRSKNENKTIIVPEHIITAMCNNFSDPVNDPFHYDGLLYLHNEKEE